MKVTVKWPKIHNSHILALCLYSTKVYLKVKVIWRSMSFYVKVISTLNDKNDHTFSMFCDLCVTWMVRFRLKSFSCLVNDVCVLLQVKETSNFRSSTVKWLPIGNREQEKRGFFKNVLVVHCLSCFLVFFAWSSLNTFVLNLHCFVRKYSLTYALSLSNNFHYARCKLLLRILLHYRCNILIRPHFSV